MGADAPIRQPIPLARSILWSPSIAGLVRSGAAARPGSVPFPIFLAQPALQAIHEHLGAPAKPGQGLLGFLVGDLCECPETNISYVVIDSALRLNQPVYSDRTLDLITRIWDQIEAQAAEQNGHLIGWYHTHPPHPLALSDHDVETHEHHFAEPWQVALVVDTGGEGGDATAGFFRGGSDEAWPTTPLPFYELLSDESLRAGGKKRSFVIWTNLRAYNPPSARTLGQVEPPARPAPEPETEPEPEPEPPPPPPPPPPPRPRPAPKSDELVFLTSADDFAGTHHAPPSPPSAAPPRRHTPPPPRRRPTPPPPPPPPRRPEPAPEPPQAEEPAEDPFAAAFEEGPPEAAEPIAEEAPPVRAPAPRRRRKRRRGLWRAAFAIVIAGAGVGLYIQFKPELPTLASLPKIKLPTIKLPTIKLPTIKLPKWPFPKRPASPPPRAAQPRPQQAQPSAAPAPRPAAPAPTPTQAPVLVSPYARLDRVGDSLALAVRNYGGGGQACDALARGLLAVEDRWTAYSAARRSAGVLDAPHALRDQTLYAGVDSVERRFERSGCTRP